ncbi:MAG: hypothetical protein K2J47_05930, partial [Ruminococcus sp.]|nr:hypothetical protein [Ruminococcus sp.]
VLDLKETFWIIGIFVFSFLSVSFIGGEYVYLRYIYYIVPLIYLVAIIVLEKLLQGKSFLSNVILIIAIIFAISNATYGTSRNYSSYLFHYKLTCKEKLEAYSDKNLYVIVENISTAVPTGNLTQFELFDKIYMSSKDNIIENDMISNTIQEQSACVVYIATDSYWLNGLDPDRVLNKALINCNAEYEEITEGNLGKFYYIHK